MTWYDNAPGRLESELASLEAAGFAFVLDEKEREDRRVIQVHVETEIDGVGCTLVATYPDEFPYFKPHVAGPNLGFHHHFNPATNEYCLLQSGAGAWRPSDTLAALLREQIPKFVAANTVQTEASEILDLEVAQAEPFSCYVEPANHEELMVVPTDLSRQDLLSGRAALIYTSADPLRGHVVELVANGQSLSKTSTPPRHLPDAAFGSVIIPWVHLESPPESVDSGAWWRAVEGVLTDIPAVDAPPARPPGNVRKNRQIVLVGFPEEVGHRSVGQGWIVLIRERQRVHKPWTAERTIRVEQAGHLDLFLREPRLRSIASSKIMLVGLGGLGGWLAQYLATMSPQKIVYVDGDIGSAATAIRNPGAFRKAGRPKATEAVRATVETQPYTEPFGILHRIGAPRTSLLDAPGGSDMDTLGSALDDVDLIIDATADLSAQHYLSDQARSRDIAYIRAEALPGVWSGIVAIQHPDTEACWMCWQHHLTDTIPALPEDSDPAVQPPGCGDPTYTGTAFDLAAIASQAARFAASYLTGPDGYGHTSTNLATVRFRSDTGDLVLPAWTGYELGKHPSCPNHQ
ncbi:ThiF family adenylyltransferase [Nocardioides sp.]|uniref:ThiF family adenylyltransferase n=1 Tax=Nocardioides sp. TaxID=35761 RepID=UPI002B64F7C2|nr:ThiF family adenylyltransferase [Nocardioides sp.]HSX66863.1 ThiF family adenylyltransferase [Nocardioides sp.]